MKQLLYTLASFLLLPYLLSGQQTPAAAQSETISISGVTAHLGNGEVLNNCTLIFKDGIIEEIGSGLAPRGRNISASGKHLYPGIIAPSKSIGLIEINAVRASDDEDEIGSMIPHVRSIIAYNAESKVVESMRPNGVLLGQVTPQGGRISGTSSIVQYDAWNWEDAVVKEDDGIHINWPSSFRRGRWWLGEPRGYQPNKSYGKDLGELMDFIENAKAYGNGNSGDINPAFQAMQGLFEGTKSAFVHTQGEREMIDAVTRLKNAGVAKVVIVGGYQAHKITDFLKEQNVPVLVNQPHMLPALSDDAYDHPYQLPRMLTEAGVLVGIQNSNMSNFQTRNLPFYAGHVAGTGLNKEIALQLITGNTAKILGIDEKYGTLETGKSATFFISEGDALDMRTNQLSHAFIDGREISLETHQTKLWKRYSEKYNNQ